MNLTNSKLKLLYFKVISPFSIFHSHYHSTFGIEGKEDLGRLKISALIKIINRITSTLLCILCTEKLQDILVTSRKRLVL